MADAVVLGAGAEGAVAGKIVARAGWAGGGVATQGGPRRAGQNPGVAGPRGRPPAVRVLEAQDAPGGAVKTAELTEPGFRHDAFSAFYPLAAASPAIRGLGLEAHGLEWCHGPLVLAHPAADGTCVALSRDLDETCA